MAEAVDIDRRQAVLDAALELFAERGYYGTRVPLIAERAGVGAGTVYRYFPSKEALVNAVFVRAKQELAESLLARVEATAVPQRRFQQLWRAMFAFAKESPATIAFLDLHHHASYLDSTSQAVESTVLTRFRGMATSLVGASGDGAIPPEVLVEIIYGSFVGLLKGALAGRYRLDATLVDATGDRLWEALHR